MKNEANRNELMIFSSPEFGQVRTIEEDGRVLFCGSDVAKALFDHCKGVLKRNILFPYAVKQGVGMQTGIKADMMISRNPEFRDF